MLYKYVDKNKKRKQKGSYRKVDELLSDQVLFVRWSKISFLLLGASHLSACSKCSKPNKRGPPLSGCSLLKIVL